MFSLKACRILTPSLGPPQPCVLIEVEIILLPWPYSIISMMESSCVLQWAHTQSFFGISLEWSLTSYLWLAAHCIPLYSTLQDQSGQMLPWQTSVWQLVYSNCYGKISHMDQNLGAVLWWVQVSSFYKPSRDSGRERAMLRILQPLSGRTRSGLQYSSPSVISAASASPLYCNLTSDLWGMSPYLHPTISHFFKGQNFRICILWSRSCIPPFLPTLLKQHSVDGYWTKKTLDVSQSSQFLYKESRGGAGVSS